MINVREDVKQKYKDDGTEKNYFIVFRDLGKVLTNSDIVSQSLSITESICSSGNFSIGLCESATMSVQVALDDNVTGDEVAIFQVLDGFEPEFIYEDGEPISISDDNATLIPTTYENGNLIYIESESTLYFDANTYYLLFLRLNYVGDEILLYTEMGAGTDRVLYYMSANQKGLVDIGDWDGNETYSLESKVKHNNKVWASRTNSNTAEPSEESNAWKDITAYINVCLPIIGSDMFMYEMKLLTKDTDLVGSANFYTVNRPLMPLGLFGIQSCKRKDLSILRQLTGYDRMQDVALSTSVYYENPSSAYVTVEEILDEAAATTQIIVGGNLSTNTESPEVTDVTTTDAVFPTGNIYKTQRDETQTIIGEYNENGTGYSRNQKAEVVGTIEEVVTDNTNAETIKKYVRGTYQEDANGDYSRLEKRVATGTYSENSEAISENNQKAAGLKLPTYTRTKTFIEQFGYTESGVTSANKAGTRKETRLVKGSYTENTDSVNAATNKYSRTEHKVVRGSYSESSYNGRNTSRKRRERRIITGSFREDNTGNYSFVEYRSKIGNVTYLQTIDYYAGIKPDIWVVYTINKSADHTEKTRKIGDEFYWWDSLCKIVGMTDTKYKVIRLSNREAGFYNGNRLEYSAPSKDSGFEWTGNSNKTSINRNGYVLSAPKFPKNTIFWLNGEECWTDKDVYQYTYYEESKTHKYLYTYTLPTNFTWENSSGYNGEYSARSNVTGSSSNNISNPNKYSKSWTTISGTTTKVCYSADVPTYMFKVCYRDIPFGYNYSFSGYSWESGSSEQSTWVIDSTYKLTDNSVKYNTSWINESSYCVCKASSAGSSYTTTIYNYMYDRCVRTIRYCYTWSTPSGFTWNNDEAQSKTVQTGERNDQKKTFADSTLQLSSSWDWGDSSSPHVSLIKRADATTYKYFYRSCYKNIDYTYNLPSSGIIDDKSYSVSVNGVTYTCPLRYNKYFNNDGIQYSTANVYNTRWVKYHLNYTYFYNFSMPEGFTLNDSTDEPQHVLTVAQGKSYTCEDTLKYTKNWTGTRTDSNNNPTQFTQDSEVALYSKMYYLIKSTIKYKYNYTNVEGWTDTTGDQTAKYVTADMNAGQDDLSTKYIDVWDDSTKKNMCVGGVVYNYKERLYTRIFKYKYNYYELGNVWTYDSEYYNTTEQTYTPSLTSTNRYSKIFTDTGVYVYTKKTKVFTRTLQFGYTFQDMPNWTIVNKRSSIVEPENPNLYDYTPDRAELQYRENQVTTNDTEHGYKIIELVNIPTQRRRDYLRSLFYEYQETAKVTTTTYWLRTYDMNMAYVAFIHHPTDWGVYLDEDNVRNLALETIQEETSEDGLFHVTGQLLTDRQNDIRNAIVNLSTIVAEVNTIAHTFTISYVSELSYTGIGGIDNQYEVSGTFTALNPYYGCISHNKKEHFNEMQIEYGSNSIHTTRRAVIQSFLEMHGLFINFDRYGISTTRNIKLSALYPSENLYPHGDNTLFPMLGMDEHTDTSLCKSINVDDVIHPSFDGICIVKENTSASEAGLYPFYYNRMSRRYGGIDENMPHIGFWDSNNYYTIENNFFIDNFIFTQQQLEDICELIIANLGDLQYFNMTVEMKCLPYLEVGDGLNVSVPGDAYDTVILRRRMKGNISQMDNIETDFD